MDIGWQQVLIHETNERHEQSIATFEGQAANVEIADPLEAITKLLDQSRALEASYEAISRIHQLSPTDYLQSHSSVAEGLTPREFAGQSHKNGCGIINKGNRAMGEHLDLVLSRFSNMLKRITANSAEFDNLCVKHAEVTAEIRKLDAAADANQAERDDQLRRRRAAMEEQMFAIMQANTRI
jgi:uncharacterized protein YdcH (DUF465 family)